MKWNRNRFWTNYLSLHGMLRCELVGWKRPCSGGYQAHHIISRHMTKGNKKARRYTEKHWHVFIVMICPAHNEIADCWEARYKILDDRVLRFGAEVVSHAVRGLLDLMKSDIPELHRYLGE